MQEIQFTNSKSNSKGFSLIELLMVIAVIAILAGIVFGVGRGATERSRISRAETELSMLTNYLEQYKAHYGDYPHVELTESESSGSATKVDGEDGIVALYDALNGRRAIDGDELNPRQRAFVDRSKFNHEFSPSQDPPEPADPEEASVAILDPWNRAYRYYYNPESGSWENPNYVLYSVGPDGEHDGPSSDGRPDKAHQDNIDNIYAN